MMATLVAHNSITRIVQDGHQKSDRLSCVHIYDIPLMKEYKRSNPINVTPYFLYL
jgi:hypothetical protein